MFQQEFRNDSNVCDKKMLPPSHPTSNWTSWMFRMSWKTFIVNFQYCLDFIIYFHILTPTPVSIVKYVFIYKHKWIYNWWWILFYTKRFTPKGFGFGNCLTQLQHSSWGGKLIKIGNKSWEPQVSSLAPARGERDASMTPLFLTRKKRKRI